MFAYCANNPINRLDVSGSRYDDEPGFMRRFDKGKPVIKHWKSITKALNATMEENAETIKKEMKENGYIAAAKYFYSKVKPGGDWDFKSQASWELNFDTGYFYNGAVLRYDDPGNIHYGYVGSVLFPPGLLLNAAGIVQIRSKTSKLSYWTSNFDDPRDAEMIWRGIELWDEGLDHE